MSEEKTIYVVFKTHFDIGFTELVEELVKRWDKQMFPKVAKVCEETRKNGNDHRYVWTMPSWPLLKYIEKFASDRDMAEKVKELVREGQVQWHALPFTTHTEFCGLEEYIRGMYFSRTLSEEYGRRMISAKMTDVVGHTWILPSLLSKAGVKFLHIGPNAACKLPEVPMLFFWEGPDNDRVLVFYNKAGGYGSSLLPPKNWPYPVWLALMQTNDNIGPQGSEVIDDIINEVDRKAPGTRTVMGTLDDFYNALSAYQLDDIPVIRGDLADTWIHGTGSYPDVVGKLRSLRHKLTETEKVMSLGLYKGLMDNGSIGKYKQAFSDAYENCILFGEHTWGLTTHHDSHYMGYERYYGKQDLAKNGDLAKFERSWDEQRQYYYNAEAALAGVGPDILDKFAGSVDMEGPRFAIFNGLGWERDAWVDLDAWRPMTDNKKVIDGASGEKLDTALRNGKLHVHVKDLPALGYKALSLRDREDAELAVDGTRPAKTDKSGISYDPLHFALENRWYRIVLDPVSGTVKSLKDKSTGFDWVGRHEKYGFGQYHYDIYGEADATHFLVESTSRYYDWQIWALVRKDYFDIEHRNFIPSGFSTDIRTDDKSITVSMKTRISGESVSEYGNASGLVFEITVYEDQPYIDLQYFIKDKEKTFCIEAGHFVFPLNLENSQVYVNKLGSVVNPALDIIEGTNHHLYCCENWMDVTDGEKGMAVIPFDTQLFSVGSHGITEFRRSYVMEEPVLLFNAFNNSYGCNFPQWMGGDYSFRYRLIPHKGDWKQGGIQKHAFESVIPPLAGFSAGKGKGSLPVSSGLIRSLEGMELLAFKPAEDGRGFIMRLREITGREHKVTLAFSELHDISRCDLLENIQENSKVCAKEIQFSTRPFEIHSFYIGLQSGMEVLV